MGVEPPLVVVHERVIGVVPEPELEGGTESKAQVICRSHTNPPLPPFTHFAQEGAHCVHPAASSVVVLFSHAAVALARPTDWYHTLFAAAGDAVVNPATWPPGAKVENIGSNANVSAMVRRTRIGVRVRISKR